jgi:hypothetical protein
LAPRKARTVTAQSFRPKVAARGESPGFVSLLSRLSLNAYDSGLSLVRLRSSSKRVMELSLRPKHGRPASGAHVRVNLGERLGPQSAAGAQARRKALRKRHANGMAVRKKRPRGFKKRPRGFK